MRRNIKREYDDKCGSCKFFAFNVRNGDTRDDGKCVNPNRVDYHQASQKACKLYQKED